MQTTDQIIKNEFKKKLDWINRWIDQIIQMSQVV